jgi:transposase-like protein
MSQLKHVVCPACEKGILTVVAEVGIEAEGSTEKFQSLSAAHGRVYKCDVCGKSFVKVDDEFLELKY